MRSAIFISLISLVACGGRTSSSSDSSHAAIVGGTDDPDDPAVVAFLTGGFPFCSGALVGPNTVLTAGHCANLIGDGGDYEIAFGEDASHPTRKIAIARQVLHPQYTAEGAPYDFALLQLAEVVTEVAPLPLGTQPLTDADVGAQIRHVGFGENDENAGTGWGTKRMATFPITEVDPLIVWSVGPGEQTCDGDSGGPGFLTRDGGEQLAAVVSDGPNCHDAGWDGRVDVVADWIASTMATWAPDAGPPDSGSSDAGAPDSSSSDSGGCSSGNGALGFVAGIFALGLLAKRRSHAE